MSAVFPLQWRKSGLVQSIVLISPQICVFQHGYSKVECYITADEVVVAIAVDESSGTASDVYWAVHYHPVIYRRNLIEPGDPEEFLSNWISSFRTDTQRAALDSTDSIGHLQIYNGSLYYRFLNSEIFRVPVNKNPQETPQQVSNRKAVKYIVINVL